MNPEAIEAAAKAAFEVRDDPYDLDEWDDLDSTERERYECDARAALEAAAPHLIWDALLEAADDMLAWADPDPARIEAADWLLHRAAAIRAGES